MTAKEQLLKQSIQDTQKAMNNLWETILNTNADCTDIAFHFGSLTAELDKLIRTIEL